MIHRLTSALALGTTLAFSGAALANPKPASPASPTHHSTKKSKPKHAHNDAHNDHHQKPAAPRK